MVGYTNAGKSKLFNCLTGQKQSSKNILFETLDTKIGRVYLNERKYIGVIDTVGFINNIPTQLVESFKATLEELYYADYLINVIDINDDNYKDKEKTTIETLKKASVETNKLNNIITVFNKVDLYKKNIENNNYNLVSAQTGYGIEELKSKLAEY